MMFIRNCHKLLFGNYFKVNILAIQVHAEESDVCQSNQKISCSLCLYLNFTVRINRIPMSYYFNITFFPFAASL